MLKITNEILEYINIKTIYLSISPDKKIVCLPLNFYDDCWRVYIGLNDSLTTSDLYIDILQTDNSFIKISCKIKKIDEKYRQYTVFFKKPLPEDISSKIKILSEKYGSAEKRQGLRLKVGKENYKIFGLDKVNQKIVISGFEYDCTIDDVSMHGIKLSFYHQKLKQELIEDLTLLPSIIGIKLMFINPLFSLFLIAEPIRVHSADKESGKLIIGCKIKEPVNIGFINRVLDFEKKMERSYVFQQQR